MSMREQSEVIRNARNLSIVFFLAFPFVSAAAAFLVDTLGVDENFVLVVIVPYVVILLFYGIRWSHASCPMCHEPMFHRAYFFYGFFRCVRCGYNLRDPSTSRVQRQGDERN
jgi:hypothetical protein